jgi:hypothetical protein
VSDGKGDVRSRTLPAPEVWMEAEGPREPRIDGIRYAWTLLGGVADATTWEEWEKPGLLWHDHPDERRA